MIFEQTDTIRNFGAKITLVAGTIIFSLLVSLGWTEIIDDAYIFFRYVYNIVEGNGYTYNVGQNVEATTSLTWTLLLSLLSKTGVSPEIGARVLGYLSGLIVIFIIWQELNKNKISLSILILVMTMFIVNRNYYASIMMGLETGLYSLLLLLLYVSAARFTQSIKYQILFSVIAILCYQTRPESLLIILFVIAGLTLLKFDGKKHFTPTIIIIVSGLLLTGLWRYISFGSIMPNSVIAKSVLIQSIMHITILIPRLAQAALYITIWFLSSFILIIPILCNVRFFIKQNSFQMLLTGAILITGFAAVIVNAGDWMPFSRLLSPYLPIIAILSGISLQKISDKYPWITKKRKSVIVSIFVIILISYSILSTRPFTFFNCDIWPAGQCYEKAGKLIETHLPENAKIAPEGIGIIGYALKKVQIFDFYGLTEPYIARHGTIPRARYTMGKHHYEYTMKNQPEIFFFHSPLANHIPYLNKFGYSRDYTTYRLKDHIGQLTIGIKNNLTKTLIPVLKTCFLVKTLETNEIQRSKAANWPLGER